MTLLVTGGAGFIGSNFIFYWIKNHPEDRVVCLDKLTYAGNRATLAPVLEHPSFRFVRGDICDREAVDRLFGEEHPQAVINFAAESHVDRSIQDPGVFLEANVLGTQVLLDACRAHGGVRFHQVSTDEVYGDLPLDRPDLLFTENQPPAAQQPIQRLQSGGRPAGPGLRTHLRPARDGEPLLQQLRPLPVPGEAYSPDDRPALAGKTLPVYGEGENVRDWLHVDDHCAALDIILQKGRAGEVYNIGGRSERTNLEIVGLICRRLEVPPEQVVHVADRKGHDKRYAIDSGKLSRQLGWHPQVPFEAGMEETINWYLDHRPWWEPLAGEV
mgnify:CR=1 FL=1